ncbi:MAG TPA: transcription antitermination factor NusB [Bacillota bacterium]|nr:transcription antitermination factor NusB [Bacillota bacterium]HPF42411.1 transcription antitermination factor NusB [Bacillota bacterium]HPJ85376.1 transcription antitermination factor NusB [Bacillota bacterium]HPQ61328.1 transcription antitermination factor NusB [Bacillota bacterium]HRX91425.1 transcription antitermination factor NusB [Candidatus Izemoplasmatales bacterium]
MNKEQARKKREDIINLIYATHMGGGFDKSQYDENVIATFAKVEEKMPDLDDIISRNLTNWTIDRLNYVDLAIIRYAVYEMKYADLPFEIAINEALELTKKYTNLDDNLAKSFNNRLLDNIKTDLFGTKR